MATVRVLILRAPGANCDAETQFAFEQAGAVADRIHINRLREHPGLLHEYQVLCIPGGFTYGDDVAAGKILAVQLRSFFSDVLQRFRDEGKLILGICNGFQALLKAGLLVPPVASSAGGNDVAAWYVPATLAHNAHGRFEDRWVRLKAEPGNCPFLQGYDCFDVPIAHGEGRFVCENEATFAALQARGQLVLRYVDAQGEPGPFPVNPNGSQGDVAGICDISSHVLGLMPHPERHILPTQHPQWTRRGLSAEGDGMRLFRNAVRHFQNG